MFERAITEPSRTLAELQAKARLMPGELEREYGDMHGPTYADERLTLTILRDVTALSV